MPSGMVAANVVLSLPPGPLIGCVEGSVSISTSPIIPEPYVMMNHGSICTRPDTMSWIRLKAKRKRMAVTRIDIELLLKSELKKKVNPSTAIRYNIEKLKDSANW